MESAFFLVRIWTPPVAAGESGVGLARHTWSVPAMSVRFVTPCAPRAFPRTRDSLFTIALARAFLILPPLSRFAGMAVGGAGSDMAVHAGGASDAGFGASRCSD
jgi:hypothetical protein